MKEEWKDIKGYEGLYIVSNYGHIRAISNPNNKRWKDHERRLSSHPNGYKFIYLSKGGKTQYFSIARLVALHFVPNPCGLPEVNHIDEDKNNNRVDNLEWCDRKYNCNYGHRNDPISTPVIQMTMGGSVIREFKSQREASQVTGIQQSEISRCCQINTGRKSAGGYKWRYK